MSSHSSLMSDPFKHDPTKIIRESNHVFEKPLFISFDLFGTIYHPKTAVPEQYHAVACELGVDHMSVAELEARFPLVFSQMAAKYPNYGRGQLANLDEWWLELIVEVFELDHYKHNETSRKLCQRLLERFTTTEAYAVYDDVVPTLRKLQEEGINIVASSNSDPLSLLILENLGLSEFFDDANVYLSYHMDVRKPDRRFFLQMAKNAMSVRYNSKFNPQLLERCWHVGDSELEDYIGSIKAGWNGILLDRNRSSEYFASGLKKAQQEKQFDYCYTSQQQEELRQSEQQAADPGYRIFANNRVAISSLANLIPIFDLD